jgi:malonyl CoA-acyl carrier protein transacylase
MLAMLFPGQGSQMIGMGKDLFDEFPEYVKKADSILGYSIKQLCLADPNKQLNQTQFTQPAIYIVNALSYFKKIKSTQVKPDYVAGHSLGEYNALLAAEVFDFETGLTLVKKRGELMSQATNGGMAALIGLKSEEITALLKENGLTNITIANYNSYLQFVISGTKEDIEKAQAIFKTIKNLAFIPLKVSGAFHSSYMQLAEQQFNEFLNTFKFNIPTIPILSNLNAELYHPQTTQSNLAQQITHAVQWVKTIEFLQAQGDIQFEEIGHGAILQGLLNRIKSRQ